MAKPRGGTTLAPLSYVFASFFGALMIAVAFAYNDYRFSKFKFIDFDKLIFYTKNEIFTPDKESYNLLIFSSTMSNLSEISSNLNPNLPTIAVDLYPKRLDSNSTFTSVSAGINTTLKLINLLNITELPSFVEIVRQKNGKIYKQNSKIIKL